MKTSIIIAIAFITALVVGGVASGLARAYYLPQLEGARAQAERAEGRASRAEAEAAFLREGVERATAAIRVATEHAEAARAQCAEAYRAAATIPPAWASVELPPEVCTAVGGFYAP